MTTQPKADPEQIFEPEELAQQSDALLGLEQVFAQDKNPTIPENVFAEAFLPFFAGDHERKHDVNLGHWHGIAGKSPFNAVDVIGKDGVVLFTVPPIADRDVINSTSEGEVSLKHVILSFQQYNNVMPSQGKLYLENQMARRDLIKRASPRMLRQLRAWDSIYRRYGRQGFLNDSDFAEEQSTPAAAISKDDLVYSSF